MTHPPAKTSGWTPRAGAGILLVAICWPLSWTLPGLRTHFLFFPLWLGYILIVDSQVARRTGSSPWQRSRSGFWLLFVASAPVWWLFELLNWRLENWIYLGREEFSDLSFFLWSTLNFSIVIPAVFETALLVRSLSWIERMSAGRSIPSGRPWRAAYVVVGISMLACLLVWPRLFFPLTWLSLFFLLDPIAFSTHRNSLLRHLARGDWRPALSLALGSLVCGFFWELWNFYSYPKWVYEIPFLDFGHVFEMPLLGYLGYLPFGLELYPLAGLVLPRNAQIELGRRSTK